MVVLGSFPEFFFKGGLLALALTLYRLTRLRLPCSGWLAVGVAGLRWMGVAFLFLFCSAAG